MLQDRMAAACIIAQRPVNTKPALRPRWETSLVCLKHRPQHRVTDTIHKTHDYLLTFPRTADIGFAAYFPLVVH